MSRSKVIGVDVDNVIVNTGSTWFTWAVLNFGITKDCFRAYRHDLERGQLDFTHGKYFPEVSAKNLLQYWHQADLYDTLSIQEDAIRALLTLERQGHEILFVSHVIGHHGHSKEQMLTRAFADPQHMWTEHKHYARVDVLIDDRFKNFQKFPAIAPKTTFVHFETAYHDEFKESLLQKDGAVLNHLYSKNWDEIVDFINKG